MKSCISRISGAFTWLKIRLSHEMPDELLNVFLDISDEESTDTVLSADPEYNRIAGEIGRICQSMKRSQNKGELLGILAEEVMRYRLKDLEQMNANFERKVQYLNGSYREKLLLKVHEQIFGAHHRLLLMYRKGEAENMTAPVSSNFSAYCDMVTESCRTKSRTGNPRILFLKYLLAAFTMFVLEEPAHPVGTPFPGGQIVDEWDGTYYCPVRDKADDVKFSLCPYCPAVQNDEPLYPWSRTLRRKKERQESLENYLTNFKG